LDPGVRCIRRCFARGDCDRHWLVSLPTLENVRAGSNRGNPAVFRKRFVCFVPSFAFYRAWFRSFERIDSFVIRDQAPKEQQQQLLFLRRRMGEIQTHHHSINQIGHHLQGCIGKKLRSIGRGMVMPENFRDEWKT
jgi:hypothetical protein